MSWLLKRRKPAGFPAGFLRFRYSSLISVDWIWYQHSNPPYELALYPRKLERSRMQVCRLHVLEYGALALIYPVR